MDLDRYLATHKQAWGRLEELAAKGRKRNEKLDDAEVDELVSLYRRTSANLSYARTHYRDAQLTAHLTQLVSASGAVIYGRRAHSFRKFARFFTTTFPAALWHTRRAILVSALMVIIPAVASGLWIANSSEVADAKFPAALRQTYVDREFEEYYASEEASQFATEVFTNNVQVAITAFGSGVALGIPTAAILVLNGSEIGFAGGLFSYVGQAGKFWGLITPHGLLEISGVIIAGGAGLALGWSIISPGDRSRTRSLAREAKRSITIVLGLVPVFLVAGLIEGFVTGQPWPTWLRVGIGALGEVAFVTYVLAQGWRAHRRGYTGAVDEHKDEGWARLAA